MNNDRESVWRSMIDECPNCTFFVLEDLSAPSWAPKFIYAFGTEEAVEEYIYELNKGTRFKTRYEWRNLGTNSIWKAADQLKLSPKDLDNFADLTEYP